MQHSHNEPFIFIINGDERELEILKKQIHNTHISSYFQYHSRWRQYLTYRALEKSVTTSQTYQNTPYIRIKSMELTVRVGAKLNYRAQRH
jgi:hypothetical protein